jgi:tubulin polyglutamylase TTLL5
LRIEDIILKTVIAGESMINNACEMFVPYSTNCFELLGFDILIDDTLKPWLLEVNLSPSLACDSPLDQKIKSNLTADLMSLAGLIHMDERGTKDQASSKKQNV